jgi:hypothetical protein
MQDTLDESRYISTVKEVIYDISSRYLNKNVPPEVQSFDELREYLNYIITITDTNYGDNTNSKIDDILQYELSKKLLYDFTSFKYNKYNVSVWCNNNIEPITTLIVDATINPINLLPNSLNTLNKTIRLCAGTRMTDDYRSINNANNINNNTNNNNNNIIVTLGYNIPSKYIIHTKIDTTNATTISKSYLECFKTVVDMRLNSVCVPIISTNNSIIVLETIKRWQIISNNKLFIIIYTNLHLFDNHEKTLH